MTAASTLETRAHVLRTLGDITTEWEEMANGERLPFTVARVDHQPVTEAVTFVTLGLAELGLRFPSGKPTRQELVFSCYRTEADVNVQGLIGAVALDCAERHRALARGEVEGPAGPILPSVEMEALYASLPAYFPDAFSRCTNTVPPTHFIWLVPILRSEAAFVKQEGWSRFEELLVRQNPDLLDFRRTEMHLPRIQLME